MLTTTATTDAKRIHDAKVRNSFRGIIGYLAELGIALPPDTPDQPLLMALGRMQTGLMTFNQMKNQADRERALRTPNTSTADLPASQFSADDVDARLWADEPGEDVTVETISPKRAKAIVDMQAKLLPGTVMARREPRLSARR